MQYIFRLKLTDTFRLRQVAGDAFVREVRHLMAAVVVAGGEEHARFICAEEAEKEQETMTNIADDSEAPRFGHLWRSTTASSCKKIGVADEGRHSGVVLTDYVVDY